jgi:hypothetical protein
MKYLVCGYNYDINIGGVVALHKLANILSTLNPETYVVCDYTFPESNAKIISYNDSHDLASDKDSVVIYPETIQNNLLNAKNIIRWVLYYPGFHGGTKEYDINEHVFLYHKEYGKNTKYQNNPILTIIDTKTDFFYNKNIERSGDCFLLKKGATKHKDILDGYYIDDHLTSKYSQNFLLLTFNKYERFISYDSNTYYSIIAAMCGCTSIVVPDPDISESEYFENEIVKYGIAYGFENENWSVTTKHLVKNHMNDLYEKSIKTVYDFHQYCINVFS